MSVKSRKSFVIEESGHAFKVDKPRVEEYEGDKDQDRTTQCSNIASILTTNMVPHDTVTIEGDSVEDLDIDNASQTEDQIKLMEKLQEKMLKETAKRLKMEK